MGMNHAAIICTNNDFNYKVRRSLLSCCHPCSHTFTILLGSTLFDIYLRRIAPGTVCIANLDMSATVGANERRFSDDGNDGDGSHLLTISSANVALR
jgi:hypothetical protein